MYTDALTYAYNCLPHSSTDAAPFDLILSKPPGPLALKQIPTKEEPQDDFKREWKHWLQETMNRTRTRLIKSQERYKRNYDSRLRKQVEVVKQGDYVFLQVERKNPKYHRHKLAPIAEGPFLVTKTDKNTVVIERSDRSVEKDSRSRKVLAPKLKRKEEVDKILRPEQLPVDGKQTKEATNLE